MIYNFGQTTSSHMPVLLEYINKFHPESVIEYGAGAFSTDVFVKKCGSVFSIETHPQWSEFIRRRFAKYKNHVIKHVDTEKVLRYVDTIGDNYDLAFVDTQNKIRVPLIQKSAMLADTIICHDTQVPFLKNVTVKGFDRIIFVKAPFLYKNKTRPYTTLWTKRKEVYEHFSSMNEVTLYQTYKFPYGIAK
jgi:hypothetical protein